MSIDDLVGPSAEPTGSDRALMSIDSLLGLRSEPAGYKKILADGKSTADVIEVHGSGMLCAGKPSRAYGAQPYGSCGSFFEALCALKEGRTKLNLTGKKSNRRHIEKRGRAEKMMKDELRRKEEKWATRLEKLVEEREADLGPVRESVEKLGTDIGAIVSELKSLV
ncbi:hypothetical protein ASPBRDRAFT_29345 [Aspergillus brasiliensis CBS 101740]|uniref:Uncharacterized protein n=1 Tax=Aspergillus brasiliensis (strain CBS 101740 / IMI 381727 / IBT 21946) TaxID=767769 RepID=A0A1L9UKW1_ASPBC|nr:hypothetical protein ASPBRDRAFT_29345 [Aspergillus brasiliensis CBS 101740]